MPRIFPQDDHDTVVQKFATQFQKNNPDKFEVIIGTDDKISAYTVGDIKPDIALFHRDETNPDRSDYSEKPTLIIEVETVGTLTEKQAIQRWKPISEVATLFQLVVPKGVSARAKRYCKRLKIKAQFQEY